MAQVTCNTRLSLTTAAALDALAAASGMSKASIIEAALVEYISKQKGGKKQHD